MALKNSTATIKKENPKKNYHKLPNYLARTSDLSDRAYRILVHILSYSESWKMTKPYLANFLGCSERTVQRYISELRDKGHVTYINEHDDKGSFAGGYYVVFEAPIRASNECTVVRMTPARRRQKKQERHEKLLQQQKLIEQELDQEKYDTEVKPANVYRACLRRLQKHYDINASDREHLALAFTDYMAGLKGRRLFSSKLYSWLENALKHRMQSQRSTATIAAAKDLTAQSHVRREVAKTRYNDNKSAEINSLSAKTTADRINDESWMDNVSDQIINVDLFHEE